MTKAAGWLMVAFLLPAVLVLLTPFLTGVATQIGLDAEAAGPFLATLQSGLRWLSSAYAIPWISELAAFIAGLWVGARIKLWLTPEALALAQPAEQDRLMSLGDNIASFARRFHDENQYNVGLHSQELLPGEMRSRFMSLAISIHKEGLLFPHYAEILRGDDRAIKVRGTVTFLGILGRLLSDGHTEEAREAAKQFTSEFRANFASQHEEQ